MATATTPTTSTTVGLLSLCSKVRTYLGPALLWPFRCTKNNANSEAPFGSAVVVAARTSQKSPSTHSAKIALMVRSSRRTPRVLGGPRKRVVCHLFPPLAPYHTVVGASFELLVVCYRLGVTVVLGVRLLDRRRHDVILAARYEQQRRPLLVAEVDVGVLVTRREVGKHPIPHEAPRRGDVVALVGLLRVFLGEDVGEGVMPLLFGEAHGPVAVGRVPKHGEGGPYLRDRHHPYALGRHRVYGDSCGPVAVVEQDLGERPTEGVAHGDRGAIQLAYDAFEVLDDGGDGQGHDGGGVLAQGLDLYLQAGVRGCEHAEALALVALDPPLPAARGHPEAVDQHDGVGGGPVDGVLGGHGV